MNSSQVLSSRRTALLCFNLSLDVMSGHFVLISRILSCEQPFCLVAFPRTESANYPSAVWPQSSYEFIYLPSGPNRDNIIIPGSAEFISASWGPGALATSPLFSCILMVPAGAMRGRWELLLAAAIWCLSLRKCRAASVPQSIYYQNLHGSSYPKT